MFVFLYLSIEQNHKKKINQDQNMKQHYILSFQTDTFYVPQLTNLYVIRFDLGSRLTV